MVVELEELIVVGTAAIGGVIWIVKVLMKPLRETLNRVNDTLEDLEKTIREEKQHRYVLDERIQTMKEDIAENTQKLSRLERVTEQIAEEHRSCRRENEETNH